MSQLDTILSTCHDKGIIEVNYQSLIPIYFESDHKLKAWAATHSLVCLYDGIKNSYTIRLDSQPKGE